MTTTPSAPQDFKAAAQVEAQKAEAAGTTGRKVTFEFEGETYTVDSDAVTIEIQLEIEEGKYIKPFLAILGQEQFDRLRKKPLATYFRFMDALNEASARKN